MSKKTKKSEPRMEVKATGGSTISRVRQTYLNIERIALDIPIWLSITIVFAIFLLIAGAVFVYRSSKYDTSLMSGELNIVVQPFMERRGEKLLTSDLGYRVAQQFATRLKTDIREGDIFSKLDISVQVRGPEDKLPLPVLKMTADLEPGAQRLGEKINSHIIIYGTIAYDVVGSPVISPKFFISQDAFGDAQEILGESELGGPFRLTGQTTSGADLMGENKSLRSRVEVLSLLLKGLTAFVSEDFQISLDYFDLAQVSNLWESTQGREVVYMLAGNTASRLANSYLLQNQLNEANSAIALAKEYYEKALEDRPDYARAYLGLGNLEYFYATSPALSSGNISDADISALERLEEYLQLALDAEYQPATSDIGEKVAFNRAQAGLITFQLTKDSTYLNEAAENYLIVVMAFDQGNSRLRELAAHANSGLGLIDRIQNNHEKALTRYDLAISLTHSPSMQALYIYFKGRTLLEMNNTKDAVKYYQAALDREVDLKKRMSPEQLLNLRAEAEALGVTLAE